jgi:hypothetical protein
MGHAFRFFVDTAPIFIQIFWNLSNRGAVILSLSRRTKRIGGKVEFDERDAVMKHVSSDCTKRVRNWKDGDENTRLARLVERKKRRIAVRRTVDAQLGEK